MPESNFAAKSHYLKIRDRASHAFVLVSVAAALKVEAGNKIKETRIALGGVAHKPRRAAEAEKFLAGKTATEEDFRLAAEAEMRRAKPLEHNKFEIERGRRAIAKAYDGRNENRSDRRTTKTVSGKRFLVSFSVYNRLVDFPPASSFLCRGDFIGRRVGWRRLNAAYFLPPLVGSGIERGAWWKWLPGSLSLAALWGWLMSDSA